MFKTVVVLFTLLVFCTVIAGKKVTEILEERADSAENIKSNSNEDESASIQVVHKETVAVTDKTVNFLNDDGLHDEESHNEVLKENNSTESGAKNDNFFEDSVSDSDVIILENRDNTFEEIIPIGSSVEENDDYSNRKEEIEIVVEHVTEAFNNNESDQEDSSALNDSENNWRSAEHLQSEVKEYSNDGANEEISLEEDDTDLSVEDYMDKKIDLQIRDRMDTRKPGRREHYTRPIDERHYGPPDEHILDTSPIRSFGEIVVPRLRPMLTRNGIVYTPTLYTVQTGPPLLDRLTGRSNWIQNRPHNNRERDFLTRPRNDRITLPQPQYDDPKMIDDYNDYGSNTYSYAPVMKVTTQAPPQQINAPNKFDIFQKLVEASNQPRTGKRTFSDNDMFPGIPGNNYYPPRQYSESYGPYDVRRIRRNAWVALPFQDG